MEPDKLQEIAQGIAREIVREVKRLLGREQRLRGLLRQVFTAQQKGEAISDELVRAILDEI